MININANDIKTISIKIKELNDKSIKNIQRCVVKSTYTIERDAKNNLAKNGSVKTGHLRRSLSSNIKMGGSKTTGEVSTNVFYAIFVEKGTNPHLIRPKRKKALYWKGVPHPVKLVRHPGGKKKPYLIPAFDNEVPNFIKEIEKAVDF